MGFWSQGSIATTSASKPASVHPFAGKVASFAAYAPAAHAALMGYTCSETAGALAEFKIRSGVDATGDVIAHVKLAPGESDREWFGPAGIDSAAGIYVERIAGTIDFTA